MKKIYFKVLTYSMFGLALFGTASCKKDGFLGQTATSNLTKTTVFADSANTVAFLSNIYSNVGFSQDPGRFLYNGNTTNGGIDAASDEAEVYVSAGSTALAFETGTINAAVVTDDAYKKSYVNIRSINQFFANLPKAPINTFAKTQLRAEAHFLRAWYYAILLKHYGGVHIVKDSIYNYTDAIPAKRNTFSETVEYIIADCDTALQDLPTVQSGVNFGRASGGAALALKSRVLLYAASPLFNGETIADAATKDLVGYSDNKPERWQRAEQAAFAVITTGAYKLYVDNATAPGFGFQKMFTLPVNNEYIFQRMRPDNRDFEELWQPPSRTGKNGALPLQGLVDAFPMSNGKLITDAGSGYDPQNPYANRDPRLDYTVIRDQTPIQNRLASGKSPIDIFVGTYQGRTTGPDAVYVGTRTGYYTNKMLDPDAVSQDFTHPTKRCWPLIRFAEILLNYAEAANEFEGPTGMVYQAVESIRQRAGLNPYQLPTGLSKVEMRKIIQNERRIELAFEEHRFWDVRRWKIADQTENVQTYGMEVDRNNATVTYKTFPVRKRNFRKAMYLWPFPQPEVAKSKEFIQNPGY